MGHQSKGQENNKIEIMNDVSSSSLLPQTKQTTLESIIIDTTHRMINPEILEVIFPNSIRVIQFAQKKLGINLFYDEATEEFIVQSTPDIQKLQQQQQQQKGIFIYLSLSIDFFYRFFLSYPSIHLSLFIYLSQKQQLLLLLLLLYCYKGKPTPTPN